jgi:hypothetical protein
MNCRKFKERLSLEFKRTDSGLPPELDDHIKTCDSCRAYYLGLSGIRENLNREDFEVFPGELDNITFEVISGRGTVSIRQESVFERIKAAVGRRAWVPAVAAVAIVALIFGPRILRGPEEISPVDQQYGNIETTVDYSSIESAEDLAYVVESLVDDASEFELVAEELIMDTDYNDLIDYLSEEELDELYDRIETINGSS